MATVKNAPETTTETPKRKSKPGPGRPRAEDAGPVREAKQNRFFEKIASIPAEEWGTRVSLWLYRLEPYTDRRRSGDHIYLMQYTIPVDEQRVMADFGSGRYRLMLTFRKPSGEGNDQRDRYEFEINNPQYPPKIPAGEWVDDVRNNKWAWAKPMLTTPTNGTAAAQVPVHQPPDMLETLETLDRIQDRAAERLKANTPDPKPQTDTVDTALKIVTLMQGGGQTALIDMFRDEMKSLREQNSELQREARTRANAPPPPAVDPLAAIDAEFERFKKYKEMFGGAKEEPGGLEEAVTKYARSKMPAWMEFLQPAVPEFLRTVQPLAMALAQKFAQGPQPQQQPHAPAPPSTPQSIPAPQQQPAGQAPANGQQPQQQPPEQNETVRFMYEMAPRVVKHVMDEAPGDIFAQWIVDGYGVERVNTIRQATPEMIVNFYRTSPSWELLKDREAQLLQFWKEFHEWKPEELTDGMEDEVKEKVG